MSCGPAAVGRIKRVNKCDLQMAGTSNAKNTSQTVFIFCLFFGADSNCRPCKSLGCRILRENGFLCKIASDTCIYSDIYIGRFIFYNDFAIIKS